MFANKLFFTAVDSYNAELWSSDGTSAGTTMVMDIAPGSIPSSPFGGYNGPSSLVVYNGTLFFAANNGVNGSELWRLR